MNGGNVLSWGLVGLVVTLGGMGLYTRRFCQRCDYCQQFYWWIGWSAFEWTSPEYDCWAMRCQACRWLAEQLEKLPDEA